ncbi:MAG: hypothetical protein IH881_18875 [Myxococcales bacterium]|nr:hypothetical protein [Myxococcales bacterium]
MSTAPEEAVKVSSSVVAPFVLLLCASMRQAETEPTPDAFARKVQIELHSPSGAPGDRTSSNPPVAAVPSSHGVEMNLGEIRRFVRAGDYDLEIPGPVVPWCRDEEDRAGQSLPSADGPLTGANSVLIPECPATGKLGEIDSRSGLDQATLGVPAPAS